MRCGSDWGSPVTSPITASPCLLYVRARRASGSAPAIRREVGRQRHGGIQVVGGHGCAGRQRQRHDPGPVRQRRCPPPRRPVRRHAPWRRPRRDPAQARRWRRVRGRWEVCCRRTGRTRRDRAGPPSRAVSRRGPAPGARLPITTTDRYFIEWCRAARASTRPSTRVTVTQTGSPSADPAAASIGPLPVDPCRYRTSPSRVWVVGNTTGRPALR